MSTHEIRMVWERGDKPFTYEEYGRDHDIFFAGGASIRASAAEAFRGNPKLPNPEDLLVAALSSCHMLSFLAIARKRGFTVEHYEDNAVGTLAKNANGRLAITTCVLHPRVRFGGPIDRAQLDQLHEESHHACFIASSVTTEVTVDVPPEAT
jgi:organic hydroperoxide reductase OsmC/OhrA